MAEFSPPPLMARKGTLRFDYSEFTSGFNLSIAFHRLRRNKKEELPSLEVVDRKVTGN